MGFFSYFLFSTLAVRQTTTIHIQYTNLMRCISWSWVFCWYKIKYGINFKWRDTLKETDGEREVGEGWPIINFRKSSHAVIGTTFNCPASYSIFNLPTGLHRTHVNLYQRGCFRILKGGKLNKSPFKFQLCTFLGFNSIPAPYYIHSSPFNFLRIYRNIDSN